MDKRLASKNIRTALVVSVIMLLIFALTFVAAPAQHLMAETRVSARLPGEHVHMPEPSLLPIVNAGALDAIIGLTISMVIVAIGLIVFLISTVIWIVKARPRAPREPRPSTTRAPGPMSRRPSGRGATGTRAGGGRRHRLRPGALRSGAAREPDPPRRSSAGEGVRCSGQRDNAAAPARCHRKAAIARTTCRLARRTVVIDTSHGQGVQHARPRGPASVISRSDVHGAQRRPALADAVREGSSQDAPSSGSSSARCRGRRGCRRLVAVDTIRWRKPPLTIAAAACSSDQSASATVLAVRWSGTQFVSWVSVAATRRARRAPAGSRLQPGSMTTAAPTLRSSIRQGGLRGQGRVPPSDHRAHPVAHLSGLNSVPALSLATFDASTTPA